MAAEQRIRHQAHRGHEIPAWHRARVPIVAGAMRGLRWYPAAGGKIIRVLGGTYEREQTDLFCQLIKASAVVYDIGAAVGYYTLLASRLVGPHGSVHAFEPDPKNASFLSRHVTANKMNNVKVHQNAIADKNRRLRFGQGSGTGTGHLCDDGQYEVECRRLDDLVAQQNVSPTHLKIDVEGAELRVLEGATTTLQRARPTIFLSTHGPKVHEACCGVLRQLDYELNPIVGQDIESASEVICIPRKTK